MRRVAFSARAEADLEAIGDFIAAHNPRRAVGFVKEVRARCEALESQPRAHRLREELGQGARVRVHPPYLVLHVARDDGRVVIERVLHGARDLDHLPGD